MSNYPLMDLESMRLALCLDSRSSRLWKGMHLERHTAYKDNPVHTFRVMRDLS